MSIRRFYDSKGQGSEPEGFETAQICENGHIITTSSDSFPDHQQDHCSKCGARTIKACTQCNQSIRGHLRGSMPSVYEQPAPRYCHKCGQPYPWTERSIRAAKELLAETDSLTAQERETLTKSVDDLVRDTPSTPLAVTRFKRFLPKAGREAAEALRTILVDIASEAAKKSLWP
jgi:hypothetical protein